MSQLGRYINRYRVFWALMLVLFAVFVYWLLFVTPVSRIYTEVEPDEVKTTAIQDPAVNEPTFAKRAGPLMLSAEGVELTVSSKQGDLILRVWAKSVNKDGPVFEIDEGILQFVLANRNTLLIKVTSCVFKSEPDLVTVSGNLVGNILGTGQYFSAEGLSWDRGGESVTADSVLYRGSNIEVKGQEMSIDLNNGEILFAGPVEAGV